MSTLICFFCHKTKRNECMMIHLFVFVIAFACLWPQGQSSFSNTVQVVIFTKGNLLENNGFSGYVPVENFTVLQGYNFTVLEGGWRSYKEILDKFCSIIQNTGVSAIISKDRSSHFEIIDVHASYMSVPVIKLFRSNHEQQVVRQVCERLLFC